MGDHARSQALDLHNFFMKIPKTKSLRDVSKAYKSLVSKKNHDKKTSEEASFENDDDHRRVDEEIWSPKLLSRGGSRRSKTPTPSSRPMSRHGSRRCTTPTSLSRSSSSKRRAADVAASSLKRILSRRRPSASFERSFSRMEISEPELLDTDHTQHVSAVFLSNNLSHRAPTPIIFSHTTARRKPPQIERTLKCTLEDLCFGCTKKIRVTRDVIKHPGVILQEEEMLKIEVQPGWRKGTKITFEGVGDEKPGYLPADIVFLIEEKKHPLFRREGNNLEVCVEIPLVVALTGGSIPIPLLGGQNMTLSLGNTVIYPGYEKVIGGQGMPNPKNNGMRGDLLVKFLVDFPIDLSEEQRKEAVRILQDCT